MPLNIDNQSHRKIQSVDFISTRDIATMIFRHRLIIISITLLFTLASGIYFIMGPKNFEAESYLQVIPLGAEENRIDKELLESQIISNFAMLSSAEIPNILAEILKSNGITISTSDLVRKISISRPVKSNLIRVSVKDSSSENAVLIADKWIQVSLKVLQKNNTNKIIQNIRRLVNKSQSDLIEKQASIESLKIKLSKTEQLVTVSKGVDDRQLWNDLSQNYSKMPEALKKISEIKIRGQEQSEEYINLSKEMVKSEQELAAVQSKNSFFGEVLQRMEDDKFFSKNRVPDKDHANNSMVELYIDNLLKNSDVIKSGEPGILWSGHGALVTTSLVFFGTLIIASLCAFIFEWWSAS
jgi:capsular polysaccharide biosynthesis protein